MVKLNKIYTRTGDDGTTALVDGSRRPKHDDRIAAYGAVDEANAALGLAQLHSEGDMQALLTRLQNDLFDLGADLATPEEATPKFEPLRISENQVARLEQEIDHLNAELAPLNSFILPGGSACAAYLHLARATLRRAERHISALIHEAGEPVNPHALQFTNRASDLLFVAARTANAKGENDILWVAGKNH